MGSTGMNLTFNQRFDMYKKMMEGRDEIDQFLILQEKEVQLNHLALSVD